MKEINIANTLILKRKEKGITQDELAHYIGVSKWETGQSYPDIAFLPQLAAYFNISIDELMNYSPQLGKENIQLLYRKYSTDFSEKPFAEVMNEVRQQIKKYYSCFPFLYQMSVLIINHYMLAENPDEQTAILEETLLLCKRVKEESEDVHLCRQANSTQAMINVLLNRPSEVIDLLDDNMQPMSQDEMVLASAYQMHGDLMSAKKTLQITNYQYILFAVGTGTLLLPLYLDEREHFEEILRRSLVVAETFKLETLHPNALFQLYTNAAYCLTSLGEFDRALEFLEKGFSTCENYVFPAVLHGDNYYDLLDDWFEEFPLGANTPRDQKNVKKILLEMLNDKVFTPLFDMPEYKSIVESVKRLWEDEKCNS